MSTDLIPFEFRGDSVRVATIDGEPWFVAADVCAVLGYRNSRDAIAKHVRDSHRRVSRIATPSGEQAMTVISESGLYRLMMRSNASLADQFQDWVTDEVLPAIRKNGRYEAAKLTPRQWAELVITESDRADRAEALALEQAPLVAQAQAHRAGVHDISRQEFAREVAGWAEREHQIKVLHRHVFAYLEHLGLFIRGDRSDQGHATTDAIRRGLAVTEKGTSETGWNYATGKLTPKGQGHAWDRIARYVEANGTLQLPRQIGGGDAA